MAQREYKQYFSETVLYYSPSGVLESIPKEILEDITGYFADDITSLLNFGRTCHCVNKLLLNDTLWRYLYETILIRERETVPTTVTPSDNFSWRKALKRRANAMIRKKDRILVQKKEDDLFLLVNTFDYCSIENKVVKAFLKNEDIVSINLWHDESVKAIEFETTTGKKVEYVFPSRLDRGFMSKHEGKFLIDLQWQQVAFLSRIMYIPVFWEDPWALLQKKQRKVTTIELVAGIYLFYLRFKFSDGTVVEAGKKTSRDEVHKISLDDDERLTRVDVIRGAIIDKITFITSKSRHHGPFGGDGGYPTHPKNGHIVGFLMTSHFYSFRECVSHLTVLLATPDGIMHYPC